MAFMPPPPLGKGIASSDFRPLPLGGNSAHAVSASREAASGTPSPRVATAASLSILGFSRKEQSIPARAKPVKSFSASTQAPPPLSMARALAL
jgi:hypothetical protein